MNTKKIRIPSACLLLISLLSSCSMLSNVGGPFGGSQQITWMYHKGLYKHARPHETKVRISLKDQKAWLLNKNYKVILETDISTGVPGYETPAGTFHVIEKLEKKRSNKYGQYVSTKTGKVVVDKTWLHKGPPPEGTEYQGISMPYWMRLTGDGVGMHVGDFPKYTRCSFGCVRVHQDAQPLIFNKTQIGTQIKIYKYSIADQIKQLMVQ